SAAASAAALAGSRAPPSGSRYPFTSSGGTPEATPGTPSGKTGLRSPASFFLLSNISIVSSESQAERTGPTAATAAARTKRARGRVGSGRIGVSLGRRAGFGEKRSEYVHARAHARRRFGIILGRLRPTPHGGGITVAPSRKREQFPCRVAER